MFRLLLTELRTALLLLVCQLTRRERRCFQIARKYRFFEFGELISGLLVHRQAIGRPCGQFFLLLGLRLCRNEHSVKAWRDFADEIGQLEAGLPCRFGSGLGVFLRDGVFLALPLRDLALAVRTHLHLKTPPQDAHHLQRTDLRLDRHLANTPGGVFEFYLVGHEQGDGIATHHDLSQVECLCGLRVAIVILDRTERLLEFAAVSRDQFFGDFPFQRRIVDRASQFSGSRVDHRRDADGLVDETVRR